MRDISDLLRAEFARSLEKLTEVMLASTSHDMRTPLNTIINMHNLIKYRETDELVIKWLDIATNSTNLL